jgi:glycosyltransferase involved in cell wall biosynthesis
MTTSRSPDAPIPRPAPHTAEWSDAPSGSTIWIVNQYAGSPVHGMEYRHYYIGRELAGRGHCVVLVSGSYSHLHTQRPVISGQYTLEDIDGLRYCWVSIPPYSRSVSVGRAVNMVAFALRLARLPTRDLPRPDAILVSSPSPFPIVVAARWARRFGARLAFEVRDIWPLTLRELGGLARLHPLVVAMQWCEDYAYRVADTVVSVLPAAAGHMVSRGMDDRKFRYLPNGVVVDDPAAAGEAPAAVRDVIDPDAFTVGFLGSLGAASAVETLVDAARLLRREHVQVVIVGQGHERERLIARAADLENVRFVDPIPRNRVAAAIRRFDACFFGLRQSSLWRFGISPNKLYDYMAAGRPILFATEAANRPVDEADCGRTVPPGDPAALAAAIRSLQSCSPAELARMGANARAYVVARHDYAVLAAELDGMLLDGRG